MTTGGATREQPALAVFGDQYFLISRLLNPEPGEKFTFMFGSALTMPSGKSRFGVPGVAAIVQMIRGRLSDTERRELDAALETPLGAGHKDQYQTAVGYLERRRGQAAIDGLIFDAVTRAFRMKDPPDILNMRIQSGEIRPDEDFTPQLVYELTEEAIGSWVLSPPVECLGRLVMACGHRFGKDILTTNFDPLIGISIRKAGGHYFRVALAEDGNLSGMVGTVPRIIHLHGFDHGTGNLHTASQLKAPRPRLKESLKKLLAARTLIVCGYGGWDDILMDALVAALREGSAREVLWTFHTAKETAIRAHQAHVLEALAPATSEGRVAFFTGVNINDFIPELYAFCG